MHTSETEAARSPARSPTRSPVRSSPKACDLVPSVVPQQNRYAASETAKPADEAARLRAAVMSISGAKSANSGIASRGSTQTL